MVFASIKPPLSILFFRKHATEKNGKKALDMVAVCI